MKRKKKQKAIIDHMEAAFANSVSDEIFSSPVSGVVILGHAGDLSRATRTPPGVKIRVYKGLSKRGVINVIVFHLKITHTSRFLHVH